MKIKVDWEIDPPIGYTLIDAKDLFVETKEEWERVPHEHKRFMLQTLLVRRELININFLITSSEVQPEIPTSPPLS